MSTSRQISYCNYLLEEHDKAGTLEDVIHEINPPYDGDQEDFEDWFARLSARDASAVITVLKENLE